MEKQVTKIRSQNINITKTKSKANVKYKYDSMTYTIYNEDRAEINVYIYNKR